MAWLMGSDLLRHMALYSWHNTFPSVVPCCPHSDRAPFAYEEMEAQRRTVTFPRSQSHLVAMSRSESEFACPLPPGICPLCLPWGVRGGRTQPSAVLVTVAGIPESSFQMGQPKSLEGRNLPRVLHPISGLLGRDQGLLHTWLIHAMDIYRAPTVYQALC